MSNHGYLLLFGITQLVHSQEEIWTGFYRRWFVFKMPRSYFVAFELVFSAILIAYMVDPSLPFAAVYVPFFAILMLANGLEHIIWSLVEKRYVPGLITAPVFLIIFVFYYAGLAQTGHG